MKKKWLSILLTLAMIVTLLPAVGVTAGAEPSNTVYLNNAKDVQAYLNNGGWHIVLTDDITLDASNKNMDVWCRVGGENILDLNNHEFIISNDDLECKSSTLFEISPGGKLTIKDSGTKGIIRYNSYLNERNTLVFRNLFDVGGQLIVEGGTLEAGRSKDKFVAGHGTVYWQTYGNAIKVKSGGKAVINNGKILGRGDACGAILVINGGKLLINNGEINGRGGASCLRTGPNADVVIRNGSFWCNTMDSIKLEGKIYAGPSYGNSGIYSSFYDPAITTVTNNKPSYRNGSIYESFDVTVKTHVTGLPDPWEAETAPVEENYTYSNAIVTAGQYADIKINVDRAAYKDGAGFIPVFSDVSVSADERLGMTPYSSEHDNPGIAGIPKTPGKYSLKFIIELVNGKQKWKVNHTLNLMVLNPDKIKTTQTVNLKKGEHLDDPIKMNLENANSQVLNYDIERISGQLPTGLDFGMGEAEDPYLYGTPLETGTFRPTFLVTLVNGDQVEVSMVINVTDGEVDPEPVEAPDDNPFDDISKDDEYYDAVLWAYYSEPYVTNGTDATHFSPWNTVKRGEAVTFLWRSEGCPEPFGSYNPFVDVSADKYYYKAVLWARENNITVGTDNTHFSPEQTLSTQHIITFLYRTRNPGKDGWNGEAAAWAADKNGKPFGVNIAVNNTTNCPRCYVVQFLYKEKSSRNERSSNGFFMYIEDVYSISGRGVIASGRVDSGKIKKGDTVRILTCDPKSNEPVEKTCIVTSIEQNRKSLDEAAAGSNVGILLRGIQNKSEIQVGDVMVGARVPMSSQTTYIGTLSLMTKEQGGRHNPISNSYIPQFHIGSTDVAGGISGLPEAGLNPGGTASNITITLKRPAVAYVGQVLTIREGGRSVGSFTVERVAK